MTTKSPSQKQIIVSMDNDNKTKFMALSSVHLINLNRALKNIKSDVMADYVCLEQNGITIVTNQVVSFLNLQVIENYIKNVNNVNSENIKPSCFS